MCSLPAGGRQNAASFLSKISPDDEPRKSNAGDDRAPANKRKIKNPEKSYAANKKIGALIK